MTKTPPKKPLRPAAYLRQSKDDQLGITRQREDTLALCKAKGWPAPQIYEDNDRSASNTRQPRPRYQELLADIHAGKVDAVVVAQLDRLHRRPIELEEFIDMADAHRLALACASGDVDLGTDDGRFMARVMGAVARKEMERKGWRQKRAAEQRAEMGEQWWSVRPFGYTRQPILDDAGNPVVNRNGTALWNAVLEPAEADLLRDAYSAVLAGSSLYAITEEWNARGMLTPRGNRWRGSQVRQVLLSPRNAGFRTFRGELQTADDGQLQRGNWPPIVDEETWRAVVVDKLGDPSRRYGPARSRKHLLSNLAACGACGSRLGSGVNSHGKLIYTCRTCNKVSRSGSMLDAVVTEAVVARLSRPDAIELTHTEERDDTDELRERSRVLRARLDSMAVEFADGVLSASQIKVATKRITDQLHEIDTMLSDAQRTHIFDGVIGVQDVAAAFAALDLDRKRMIIDALVAVTVNPIGRVGRSKVHGVDLQFKCG